MSPRQASKDIQRLKEKIEKERIEKEQIQTVEGREIEEKEKEVKIKMMEKEVQKQGFLIEGNPCSVSFVYESDNNDVSQRLVEKLKLPTSFHPNQARVKSSR